MRVVAIDPGGTTGLVLCDVDNGRLNELGAAATLGVIRKARGRQLVGSLEVKEINCRDVMIGFKEVRDVIDGFNPHVIVIEGFELWTMAADLTPVKILALVDWVYANGSGEGGSFDLEVVVQMPAERSVITSDRLKLWGLWYPGMKDGMAAMQHLIVYLRKLAS